MLKREWGVESNGKLPHLFIPSKTATLVPEYAVEDLPLVRTVALVPEFAVNTLVMMYLGDNRYAILSMHFVYCNLHMQCNRS